MGRYIKQMLDEVRSDAIVKELSLLAVKNGHVTKDDIRKSMGAELADDETVIEDIMGILCEQDVTVLENGGTPMCASLNEEEPQVEGALEEDPEDDDSLLDDDDVIDDDVIIDDDVDVEIEDFDAEGDDEEHDKKGSGDESDDDDEDED